MTGIIIPFYVYPTDPTWSEVIRAKRAYPFNPILAVVNPDSGPGVVLDPIYAQAIWTLKLAGVKVLGYITTGYGVKDRMAIQAEQVSYRTWYHVSSWFFDEVAADATHRDYYAKLGNTVDFTVGNPGVKIPNDYIGLMDNFVVYEGPGMPNQPLPPNFDPKNFSFIAYGLTTFPSTITIDGYGYIYLTNGVEPDPYSSVSWLWETLAALQKTGVSHP